MILSFFRMKNVIIRGFYAVGMHHYGSRELAIGPLYYAKPEPLNRYDSNAVAIFSEDTLRPGSKVAYIRREHAKIVKELFDGDFIVDKCYLRAKASPEKYSKRSGPMQNISIGFKVADSKKSQLEIVLQKTPFAYKIF